MLLDRSQPPTLTHRATQMSVENKNQTAALLVSSFPRQCAQSLGISVSLNRNHPQDDTDYSKSSTAAADDAGMEGAKRALRCDALASNAVPNQSSRSVFVQSFAPDLNHNTTCICSPSQRQNRVNEKEIGFGKQTLNGTQDTETESV